MILSSTSPTDLPPRPSPSPWPFFHQALQAPPSAIRPTNRILCKNPMGEGSPFAGREWEPFERLVEPHLESKTTNGDIALYPRRPARETNGFPTSKDPRLLADLPLFALAQTAKTPCVETSLSMATAAMKTKAALSTTTKIRAP
ncbi:hypothetical protein PG999_014666 [Apiospora kogelbergensis]|uniref:Uncharacterized protein n=1 Tax=Apiospora kogelbergensis TaxID=1337665 RepID=A0AAW0Q3W3_9PEZI